MSSSCLAEAFKVKTRDLAIRLAVIVLANNASPEGEFIMYDHLHEAAGMHPEDWEYLMHCLEDVGIIKPFCERIIGESPDAEPVTIYRLDLQSEYLHR